MANGAIGWTVYFDAPGTILSHVRLLEPLLSSWIGGDVMRHYEETLDWWLYRPDDNFYIGVERNAAFGKSAFDNDRFRKKLDCVDLRARLPREEHRARIIAALERLWAHQIPTCTPGLTDELPNGGGEDGPVPWPR
ncbi:MAG: hypothetical protein HUU21_26460 [Polyangiaceae bacterium]|nr:hypothetical protein [Polyangiaceae bacterium]NUQ77093.1 hypothetical protein [Polyangiaceae bacterium]